MAVSWDEFIISWFVSGFDITLPVKIFNLVQGTISPQINAIGTVVFGMTITLVLLAQASIFVWGRTGGRGSPFPRGSPGPWAGICRRRRSRRPGGGPA